MKTIRKMIIALTVPVGVITVLVITQITDIPSKWEIVFFLGALVLTSIEWDGIFDYPEGILRFGVSLITSLVGLIYFIVVFPSLQGLIFITCLAWGWICRKYFYRFDYYGR